jgi:succinate dehydrogenase / fumarate reductase flavoprotein subunit
MLVLAELVALASLEREESRGSHYRLDFPDRDDARFLKTSVGVFEAGARTHRVDWREVDTSLVTPRARTYGKTDASPKKDPEKAAPAAPRVGAAS